MDVLQATTGSGYSEGTGTGHVGDHVHRSGDSAMQTGAAAPQVQALLQLNASLRPPYIGTPRPPPPPPPHPLILA